MSGILAFRRNHGFSLVELMISLVLGLLLIGGVSALFLSNKQSYGTNQSLGEVQDNSRVAFELLARDIRQGGLTGCGNSGRVANTLNNSSNGSGTQAWWAYPGNDNDKTWSLWSVRGYDGNQTDPAVTTGTATGQRLTGTSSLRLMGASEAGYSLLSQSASNATININESGSDLAAGDVIVVCDPDHATIMQITAFTAPQLTHSNSGGTIGNCSKGIGYPTDCSTATGNPYNFGPNALISKLKVVDWYLGNNAQGGTSLYRAILQNSGGTPTMTTQEMVRNVSVMTITYHVAGGTTFTDAASVATADWANIDAVQVALRLVGTDKRAGTGNSQLKRDVSATISFRNRTT